METTVEQSEVSQTNIKLIANEKVEYSEFTQADIKSRGSCIFLKYRKLYSGELLENNNVFLIQGEMREYEANPAIALLLANDIRTNGFLNITPQNALILYIHLGGCKNLIVSKARSIIKNTHNESLSNEIYASLYEYSTELYNAYNSTKWKCLYMDPMKKIWHYKLGLYYWNTVFAEIVKLRVNNNTENFMPDILDLETNEFY